MGSLALSPDGARNDAGARRLQAVSCAVFGHQVDNRELARTSDDRRSCRCGRPYLQKGAAETRVRHTVSCFLKGHTYVRTGSRHDHNEYVCIRCGHPLLFQVDRDPYAREDLFGKKVRYFCNLFGHSVHTVCRRGGFTEYACHCGHVFLRPPRVPRKQARWGQEGLARVTHPPVCLFAGHFVRFVEHRDGHAEFRCRNCGHTFGFAEAA